MSKDPIENLRQGLATWWDDQASLDSLGSVIVGRIGRLTAPSKTEDRRPRVSVNFSDAVLDGTSTDSRFHRISATFRIYDESPESAAASGLPLVTLLEAMEADSGEFFALPSGNLVGVRVVRHRTRQADKVNHFAEHTALFRVQTNRG